MKAAAFTAKCPYEIGDRVNVIKKTAGRVKEGQMFFAGTATITDIACTHYLKSGKVLFTYEPDGSGQYAPLANIV